MKPELPVATGASLAPLPGGTYLLSLCDDDLATLGEHVVPSEFVARLAALPGLLEKGVALQRDVS